MTTVEIILLVAGILCLIASFMIPDEKKIESKEESSVNRQPVQELTQAEQDKVRERINDIINEQLGDISEKTEAQLDKISNTKILELNEYINLFVTVLSFGFKYGIPVDADIVFDVRFLPNPYYIEELKHLTGNDKPVQDYVKKAPETTEFLEKIDDLLKFLLPNYVKEGKNSLVIAIGCTGGKHRSVTLANELAARIASTPYGCKAEHRDIDKDAKRKGDK